MTAVSQSTAMSTGSGAVVGVGSLALGTVVDSALRGETSDSSPIVHVLTLPLVFGSDLAAHDRVVGEVTLVLAATATGAGTTSVPAANSETIPHSHSNAVPAFGIQELKAAVVRVADKLSE